MTAFYQLAFLFSETREEKKQNKMEKKMIMMMTNPRRSSDRASHYFQSQSLNSIIQLHKKPHAFPILLSVFLLLTWISLRLQGSSSSSSLSSNPSQLQHRLANLVRFSASSGPSLILKDRRGWMIDPVQVALEAAISGGATVCTSVHLGEIRPGGLRGNHRHYTCNETFVIWGAKTKFRLENHKVPDKHYGEAVIDADEVAVATSHT